MLTEHDSLETPEGSGTFLERTACCHTTNSTNTCCPADPGRVNGVRPLQQMRLDGSISLLVSSVLPIFGPSRLGEDDV